MSNAMSLKARIRNIAKGKRLPAQVILQNYMFERLLVRLAASDYKDKFVLKGGRLVSGDTKPLSTIIGHVSSSTTRLVLPGSFYPVPVVLPQFRSSVGRIVGCSAVSVLQHRCRAIPGSPVVRNQFLAHAQDDPRLYPLVQLI